MRVVEACRAYMHEEGGIVVVERLKTPKAISLGVESTTKLRIITIPSFSVLCYITPLHMFYSILPELNYL